MLFDQIQADLKTAMIARDETKVSTLRLLLSELKYAQIQKNQDLEDSDIVSVIQKEVKKRKEGAAGFRQGKAEEKAQKEESESAILETYLPAQMSDDELTKIVEDTINEVGATTMADMGKVIGMVKGKVGSGADGARISEIAKNKLQVS